MPKFLRGAKKSPRHKLLAATPHRPLVAPPPQFAVVPRQLNMEGNDQYGDCVSAEEAWAKAWWSVYCGMPELLPTAAETIAFARQYGYLDGADLTSVMDTMKTNGMVIGGQTYRDGDHSGVDYSNESILQSANSTGPVKIAIDANALPSDAGSIQGWYATQKGNFPSTDHCVGIGGYGSAGYLFDCLQVPLPSALSSSTPGYIVYTWATHGFVTHDWLMGTCAEAWVREPTTVGQTPNPPTPPAPTPDPGPLPMPLPAKTVNFAVRWGDEQGSADASWAAGSPTGIISGTCRRPNTAKADMPVLVNHDKNKKVVGLSLRGLWSFLAEYWHLLKPYLAEYGPVVEQTVVADLIAGKSYPEILADVAEALIAAGAPAPALAA